MLYGFHEFVENFAVHRSAQKNKESGFQEEEKRANSCIEDLIAAMKLLSNPVNRSAALRRRYQQNQGSPLLNRQRKTGRSEVRGELRFDPRLQGHVEQILHRKHHCESILACLRSVHFDAIKKDVKRGKGRAFERLVPAIHLSLLI
jgi:hypothetical protein